MVYKQSKTGQIIKYMVFNEAFVFSMFGMVLEKLFVPEIQKISGNIERKIVACGVTKLLCECPEIYTGNYQKHWSALLQVRSDYFQILIKDIILCSL